MARSKAEMKIKLENTTSVYYRPYRVYQAKREQVQNTINDLKKADVIEDSNSPLASPVILMRKKDR